jgi:uncharacterized protein YigA (DUF484 family)
MTEKTRSMSEIVAKYLRRYPDFLARHPEILETLELPHDSGPAVSLIERQVEQLREQNRTLSRQLNQLVKVATDNEELMFRLHRLTLDLMMTEDLGDFFDLLAEALLSEFNADILNISLFEREIEVGVKTPLYNVRRDDPELKQFQENLEKGKTVCGRLNRNKLDFLFRNRAPWVESTAMVPLGDEGLIAIGSADPARFYPGMGTMFLDLLASVVTGRLAQEVQGQQRRTA